MLRIISRAFVFTLLSVGIVCTASAQLRYFDGFGDGDLNNDGIALGILDTDINLNEMVDGYEPPEFMGAMVNEPTVVEDASDTGIRWLFSRGWTGGGDPKANIKILDDSVGLMPDSTHPTYPVQSLDSGFAMAYDSKGRGSSITGFFPETVELGPDVGNQVKVSFDFRVWLSGTNANNFTPPRVASLRFGLFEDTDSQIGMTNDFAGPPDPVTGIPGPAVWGVEGGHFRGDLSVVGANEDHGWYGIVDLGQTDFAGTGNFNPADFDGLNARINEEINDAASGGRFLEGSDNDFVAKTDEMAPSFTALDITKNYNLAMTLERATDVTEGDTIKSIITVTEIASGQSWTLEGTEPIADSMGVADGVSSQAWDYFAIRNTTPINTMDAQGNPITNDGDDFDFILDNFMVEVFDGTMPVGADINGDGSIDCLDVDGLVAVIAAGTNDLTYDLTGDQQVTGVDLTEWLALAGAELNASGNPILVGDANLDGTVDGLDFIDWNTNKFTMTPAWCSGDFNADGTVDGLDFIEWNNNKFTTADGVSAVPEPGSLALVLLALPLLVARQRR